MGFFDALVCWLKWMIQSGASVAVDAFKLVLGVFAAAVNVALGLLPEAALDRPPAIENGVLGTMNYFLPIGPLAGEVLILIAAWGAYRLYRYIFSWAHI